MSTGRPTTFRPNVVDVQFPKFSDDFVGDDGTRIMSGKASNMIILHFVFSDDIDRLFIVKYWNGGTGLLVMSFRMSQKLYHLHIL